MPTGDSARTYRIVSQLTRTIGIWCAVTFGLVGVFTIVNHVLQTVPGSGSALLVTFGVCACAGGAMVAAWSLQTQLAHAIEGNHPYYVTGGVKSLDTTVDSMVLGLVTISENFVSAPSSRILVHGTSALGTSETYRVRADHEECAC